MNETSIVRAIRDAPEIRAGDGGGTTMVGHFSMFDVPYEVNSISEGRFMESVAPGTFSKTISENRDAVKVLFNHGQDMSIDSKVLGTIIDLEEDTQGARFGVSLFDTSYNRDLLPGLRAGVYGSSFRFEVLKDQWVDDPGRSDANPDGLPERTIREVRLHEFGPVTFPASPTATAGVRSISMTDDWRSAHDHSDKTKATPTPEPAPEPETQEPQEHSDGLTAAERQMALRQYDLGETP
jgi:HK97 family phage prohead protease